MVTVTPISALPRAVERPLPPPVAEETTRGGVVVEGALLRLATAPDPLQMFNPAAPRSYGNASDLVTYSYSYRNVDANPNERYLHATGIKLLSFLSW